MMARKPRFTPGVPLDPVAVMFPGLPLFARMAIGYVLMWFGIYHPLRTALRRQRDSLQIYNLCMTLNVPALTQRAEHYTVHEWIGTYAVCDEPSFSAQLLGSISPTIEIDRVSPTLISQAFCSDIAHTLRAINPEQISMWAQLNICERLKYSFTRLGQNIQKTHMPIFGAPKPLCAVPP